MPQSLSAVYVHAVFSTKERIARFGYPELRRSLHALIGATSRELDCAPIQVGGTADHVHILARQGRQITQSEWIKEMKRISSRWVKTQSRVLHDFAWQDGYAVFSVSPSNLERVRTYVAEQQRHHERFDYRRELVTLLKRHGLECDERYLWD